MPKRSTVVIPWGETMKTTISAVLFALLATPALAAGNLGSKPTALPELVVGTGDGFGVSQATYDMETGKSYSLMIKATGAQECAFQAKRFFSSVWLRKVEAGGLEIKAPYVTELEFENAAEAEIFVVPIVPGEYVWECEGLADKGLTGTFIVK